MALTESKQRVIRDVQLMESGYNGNVDTAVHVYIGANLFLETTGLLLLAPTATSRFAGVAEKEYENTTGAATTDNPVLARIGQIELYTDPGFAVADIGKVVYGNTDDETITLTPGAATNPIGFLADITSDGAWVKTARLDGLV